MRLRSRKPSTSMQTRNQTKNSRNPFRIAYLLSMLTGAGAGVLLIARGFPLFSVMVDHSAYYCPSRNHSHPRHWRIRRPDPAVSSVGRDMIVHWFAMPQRRATRSDGPTTLRLDVRVFFPASLHRHHLRGPARGRRHVPIRSRMTTDTDLLLRTRAIPRGVVVTDRPSVKQMAKKGPD